MPEFDDLLTPELLERLHARTEPITFGPDASWGPAASYRPDLGRELYGVHQWVNETVTWTSDMQTRGRHEHWGLPVYQDGVWRGDCDDYVAAYRKLLQEIGWQEELLRRVVCFAPTREEPEPRWHGHFNHAVLGVTLYRKSKIRLAVLDNRQRRIVSMNWLFNRGWQSYKNFAILCTDGEWRYIDYEEVA